MKDYEFPGGPWKDVFKSKEEYEEFRREFHNNIKDKLEEVDRAQLESWREARKRR